MPDHHPLREETLELLEQARAAARRVSPWNTVLEMKTADGIVMFLYWRSVRLYDGVAVLIERELPEEALILARSLFVESLRLAEIAAAGRERDALVLGWAKASIEQKRGLVRDASSFGVESEPEKQLRILDEEQRDLQGYAKRHGVGRLRKFQSERSAARQFGRTRDFWTYALAHEMVHGSDAAFMFNRKSLAGEAIAVWDRTSDPKFVLATSCFAMRSLIQAARATADVFGWPGAEQLDDLSKRITDTEDGEYR